MLRIYLYSRENISRTLLPGTSVSSDFSLNIIDSDVTFVDSLAKFPFPFAAA